VTKSVEEEKEENSQLSSIPSEVDKADDEESPNVIQTVEPEKEENTQLPSIPSNVPKASDEESSNVPEEARQEEEEVEIPSNISEHQNIDGSDNVEEESINEESSDLKVGQEEQELELPSNPSELEIAGGSGNIEEEKTKEPSIRPCYVQLVRLKNLPNVFQTVAQEKDSKEEDMADNLSTISSVDMFEDVDDKEDDFELPSNSSRNSSRVQVLKVSPGEILRRMIERERQACSRVSFDCSEILTDHDEESSNISQAVGYDKKEESQLTSSISDVQMAADKESRNVTQMTKQEKEQDYQPPSYTPEVPMVDNEESQMVSQMVEVEKEKESEPPSIHSEVHIAKTKESPNVSPTGEQEEEVESGLLSSHSEVHGVSDFEKGMEMTLLTKKKAFRPWSDHDSDRDSIDVDGFRVVRVQQEKEIEIELPSNSLDVSTIDDNNKEESSQKKALENLRQKSDASLVEKESQNIPQNIRLEKEADIKRSEVLMVAAATEESLNVSRSGQEEEVNAEQILSVRSRRVSSRLTGDHMEEDSDNIKEERNPKKELLERFQQSSDASLVDDEALNISENVGQEEEKDLEPQPKKFRKPHY